VAIKSGARPNHIAPLGSSANELTQLVVEVGGPTGTTDLNRSPRYPASYDIPFVISVASIGKTDELTSTSNWGATHVAVAARGEELLTPKPGGGYENFSGTSAAAATVSGVAGLLKTLRPRLSASLTQQLAGLAANLNGNPDAAIEDHPRYKDALAARNEAARQLAHTIVRAPFAGVVTNVPSLQPDQYLAAAATAFNIVSSDHVWVQASPKETELTFVRPGQKATVEVDTYPGQQWTGTVESISPAAASSFSLLPAENTSGNWVKVVQRIPVRVRVDNAPGRPPLRVGISVELSVDTGHERGLPSFLTGLLGSAGAGRG